MPVKKRNGTGGGGGGESFTREYLIVDTTGQTTFTLMAAPENPSETMLLVHAVEQEYGADKDYTVSGTTLTWNNKDFQLVAGEKIEVRYFTS